MATKKMINPVFFFQSFIYQKSQSEATGYNNYDIYQIGIKNKIKTKTKQNARMFDIFHYLIVVMEIKTSENNFKNCDFDFISESNSMQVKIFALLKTFIHINFTYDFGLCSFFKNYTIPSYKLMIRVNQCT